MAPLFTAGDEVTLEIDPDQCLPIARGDVVVYQNPSRPDPFLKMVKAVPGDRVALTPATEGGWHLLVNGAVATTTQGLPYIFGARAAKVLEAYFAEAGGVIPPERYLLLGNRAGGSIDSSRFGLVKRRLITGKLRAIRKPEA